MRRREVAGETPEAGNGKDDAASNPREESMRAKSAAAAATKKQAEARRGWAGTWRNIVKLYKRADDVVNMPFLIVFSAILVVMVVMGSKPKHNKKISPDMPVDQGEGESNDWRWVQSQGKDVVGKVNCTTYMHVASETLLELGHGSGGGLAFKIGEKGKVKYVPYSTVIAIAWVAGSLI